MRRLLLLVCALVWVDTMLYAALTPLLPHFTQTLHLSKAGAGALVAADAAGALVGGLPGGAAAARLGARRAVLAGLTLMGLASLGFAFAHGFWPLAIARFLQGCASGFTWAGAFAWLCRRVPAVGALRTYSRAALGRDLTAGLTVAKTNAHAQSEPITDSAAFRESSHVAGRRRCRHFANQGP